jgi:RNA polymerase sigma-70 factor (ECF subfamily)
MTSEKPSIDKLIASAKEDASHLDELFRWYRPYLKLRALADARVRRLGTKLDGSDIAQDALHRAHQGFERFEGTSEPQLTAWLQSILSSAIKDVTRAFYGPTRDVTREKSWQDQGESASLAFDGPLAEGSSAGTRLLKGESALILAKAIASLPNDQADAIRLKYLESMQLKQVAELLGKSEAAVAGLLRRGAENLRKRLGGE